MKRPGAYVRSTATIKAQLPHDSISIIRRLVSISSGVIGCTSPKSLRKLADFNTLYASFVVIIIRVCCKNTDCLISESKLPKGDDIAIACFDVIFDNIAFGRILYLLLLFPLSTHLKCLPVYFEIAYP